MPALNTMNKLRSSQLQYPATYSIVLSATLNSKTIACPAISVSPDLIDCTHSMFWQNNVTQNLTSADIKVTQPND